MKIPTNYIEQYNTPEYGGDGAEDIYKGHLEILQERIDSLDPQVREALDIYISWLNQPQEGREYIYEEHPYEIEDFFRYQGTGYQGRPDTTFFGLHSETLIGVDVRVDENRLIRMSAGTADEGGPAHLTILIDESYDDAYIYQITQEFDTMHSIVYFAEEEGRGGIVPFGWSPHKASGEDPQA